MANSLSALMKFLSTPERPVTTAEMTEFWKSCTDEEKDSFKQAKLPSK